MECQAHRIIYYGRTRILLSKLWVCWYPTCTQSLFKSITNIAINHVLANNIIVELP